jgi:hypothetical protein
MDRTGGPAFDLFRCHSTQESYDFQNSLLSYDIAVGCPVLDAFRGRGSWFAGAGVVFPFTQEKIPIWFASIPCVDVVREY